VYLARGHDWLEGHHHDHNHDKSVLSYWHPETVVEEEEEEESVTTSDIIAASKPQLGILATLWCDDVITSVLICCATCFLFTSLDETFALFCSLPIDQGGLGFNEPRIGIPPLIYCDDCY
jgi:hypothetical protein